MLRRLTFIALAPVLVLALAAFFISKASMGEAGATPEMKAPTDPVCFGGIGLHNVTLKDSSKADEFEAFLKGEYNALFRENFPGMRFTVLKADRGSKLGEYMSFAVFDSPERRDEYFPAEGVSSEDFKKKWPEVGGPKIMSRFREYAKSSWVSDYRVVE